MSIGGPVTQLAVLTAAALAGMAWCRQAGAEAAHLKLPIASAGAWSALGLFRDLAVGAADIGGFCIHALSSHSPIFSIDQAPWYLAADTWVLPLLRDAMVPSGWISDDRFLTGYGFAQAVPGPLFTLAAYLGAANDYAPSAWSACVAVIFIFSTRTAHDDHGTRAVGPRCSP